MLYAFLKIICIILTVLSLGDPSRLVIKDVHSIMLIIVFFQSCYLFFHTFKINDKINFIPVSIHFIKLLQIYVQSRDKMVGNIKVSLCVNFLFYFWSPCGQIDTHFVEIYIPQNTQNHRNGRAVLFLSCSSV